MNHSKYFKLVLNIAGDEYQENAIGVLHYLSNFESVEQLEDKIIVSYKSENQSRETLCESIREANLCMEWNIEDEPDINWNEQYEKSFQPISILNNSWGVRASFHEPLPVQHEIVIDPKMSFGTGHHETTKQMMEYIANMDFKNKTVWDYGSGTGILAIMASMLGASSVKGNDNEEWAYLNSLENKDINRCSNIEFQLGDIPSCEKTGFLNPLEKPFDIIIANITKNILLDSAFSIDQYSHDGSILLLSGFYTQDIADIEKKYKEYHFTISAQSSLNNWAALQLIKNKS